MWIAEFVKHRKTDTIARVRSTILEIDSLFFGLCLPVPSARELVLVGLVIMGLRDWCLRDWFL